MLFSTEVSSSAHQSLINDTNYHRSLLVVEDDTTLNEQLTDLLSHQKYHVTSTTCGEKALRLLKLKHYDLVLLDVDLPNIDGFSLLNFVHANLKIPVIMLTAYGAEEHRIRGFKSGADDYISKPCSFTEISLRIEAVLRRTKGSSSSSANTNQIIVYQELELNRIEQTVRVTRQSKQSNPIQLTPIQFKLLWVLVQNAGAIQSKPYLYQAVLERDFSQYDRSLDMHLSRVRKRLITEGMNSGRIQTVHSKGYILK